VFSAKVLLLGYPSLSDYIALKYSGQNEPFISPPRRPVLTSNEPTPPDSDTTYIDEEEDYINKKTPAKKSKTTEKKEKEKSPEGRFKRNERVQKNYEISKVAAAAAAAAMQVDELEDTDFGGGYSDQSSHGYEGVVAPDSPPTPKVKKKHERTLPTHKQKGISGVGGGKKDDLSSISSKHHPSPPPEVKKNLPDHPPATVKNILLAKTSASGGAKKDDDLTSSEHSVSPDHYHDPEWKLKGKKNVDVGGRKSGLDL